MKLSIITINYNNIDGLRRTIDSVVTQTWQEFEWIIIDGGSTDGSKELIELTVAICPLISYWCSEPDNGIYNAMNKGIAKANGEYCLFLNSGDYLHTKSVLSNIYSRLESSIDVLYGNIELTGETTNVICKRPQNVDFIFFYHGTIFHQASFIRRLLLIESPYDETLKIVSDWKSWLKWSQQGKKFEYIDYVISYFDTTGISNKDKRLEKEEREIVLGELFTSSETVVLNRLYEYEKIADNYDELKRIYYLIRENKRARRMLNRFLHLLSFIWK